MNTTSGRGTYLKFSWLVYFLAALLFIFTVATIIHPAERKYFTFAFCSIFGLLQYSQRFTGMIAYAFIILRIFEKSYPPSLCWIDFSNPLNSEKGQLCRMSFPIYSKCKETENCPCNTNKITKADRVTANTGILACYQSSQAKFATCFLKRIGRLLIFLQLAFRDHQFSFSSIMEIHWQMCSLGTSFWFLPQGADPPPPKRSAGREKSFERVKYPPSPRWDRRAI
jgi:hypothetical protein